MSAPSLLIASVAAATPLVSCEQAMAERERVFRPIALEMKALLAEDRRSGGGKDGYPSLRLSSRFIELDEKVRTFQRRYLARDCKTEKRNAQNR